MYLDLKFLILALAAMVPKALAIGSATIVNSCTRAICVYTTTPGGGSITQTLKLKPSKQFRVPYPANGMVGTQIRVSPNCDPNNIVYWEFAQGNNIIYYDVNINGPTSDPFTSGLRVSGSSISCPTISCPAGGDISCFNNPNGNPQNQVKSCQAINSIYFHACQP